MSSSFLEMRLRIFTLEGNGPFVDGRILRDIYHTIELDFLPERAGLCL